MTTGEIIRCRPRKYGKARDVKMPRSARLGGGCPGDRSVTRENASSPQDSRGARKAGESRAGALKNPATRRKSEPSGAHRREERGAANTKNVSLHIAT